ncbi:maleylpyruvate isomerase N-terminal domain-containing protein [Isoptericola sp. BMS4]|uniref:maleylpyruvate isomerase N-terminal domain-containing protein n=1 Tax=Isoptericola sp. BMS4 TaxID=2527875 RepID=UPI001F0D8967|nr:maleylpyruvate isomerase N-terminal domain-containing protein [Isoptericola sp. BMS4]
MTATDRPAGQSPDLPAFLPLLERLQETFAQDVLGTAPDARVPACGDWRVRDLVVHLAGVHRWAAGMARRERVPDAVEAPDHELHDTYTAAAAELRETLGSTPLSAAAWTLLGDGTAEFWHRRQVHETLVHLHDLRVAGLGSGPAVARRRPVDVPAAVWADAVDEVVTLFQPRQVRLGRLAPLPATVALDATDTGDRRVLGAHEDGRAAARPAAAVAGPARDLALVLWGRLTTREAGLEVDGDADVVAEVLASPIVP